jgi:hypothetical protein
MYDDPERRKTVDKDLMVSGVILFIIGEWVRKK